MDVSAIGLGAGLTFGARLGAKAAESTLNFASLLSEKIQGEDSSEAESADTQSSFQTALNKFDAFLKSIGVVPEQARAVEFSSELGDWHATLNTDSLSPSVEQLIDGWKHQFPADSQTLHLS